MKETLYNTFYVRITNGNVVCMKYTPPRSAECTLAYIFGYLRNWEFIMPSAFELAAHDINKKGLNNKEAFLFTHTHTHTHTVSYPFAEVGSFVFSTWTN